VLALAWALVGYSSLFDLGLGRALTQQVAEKLGVGQDHDIPVMVWTSLILILIFGIVGTVVLGLLSPWLVHTVLKIPKDLRPETLRALYLLALSIPTVISAAALRGALEAHQRFDLTSAVRTATGILTLVGPLVVVRFSKSLVPVVGVMLGVRVLACIVSFWLCLHVMPALRRPVAPRRSAIAELISFGGWMTVTNVLGPLMSYMDRFIIGAMISVSAVAYYTTPSEAVGNLGIIPAGIVGVLFPAFAMDFRGNPDSVKRLFRRGLKYTYLILFPLTLLVMAFAREGLQFWLGSEFAKNSFVVLQWLTFGRLFNSLAQLPFGLVQGAGFSHLTGKLHLIELPFYLVTVWWLTRTMGIEGTAIAWVARVMVDTLILFGMAQRLLRYGTSVVRDLVLVTGVSVVILLMVVLPIGIPAKLTVAALTVLVLTLVGLKSVTHETQRPEIFAIVSRFAKAFERVK